MRILIVEDEAINAMMVKQMLRKQGHETVASTAKGESVLELAKLHDPDLVLMDIALAGDMNGIDAALELRQISQAGVIFTTGYGTDEMREKALSVPRSLFLTKPIVESELKVSIDAFSRERSG